MSEDIDPSKYSDSKWTRALKKRDAEIERLREENAMMTEQAVKFRDRQNALITELADALVWWAKHKDYDPEFAVELKKRAREATK